MTVPIMRTDGIKVNDWSTGRVFDIQRRNVLFCIRVKIVHCDALAGLVGGFAGDDDRVGVNLSGKAVAGVHPVRLDEDFLARHRLNADGFEVELGQICFAPIILGVGGDDDSL